MAVELQLELVQLQNSNLKLDYKWIHVYLMEDFLSQVPVVAVSVGAAGGAPPPPPPFFFFCILPILSFCFLLQLRFPPEGPNHFPRFRGVEHGGRTERMKINTPYHISLL
jgi:hypothetical protein